MKSNKEIIQVPDAHPSKYLDMPEGLRGYWWETDNQICVPLIENQHEGDGAFSKWLNKLEAKNKLVFFPTVVSGRLDMILRKRGYQDAFVIDKEMGLVDGLAHQPSQNPAPKTGGKYE